MPRLWYISLLMLMLLAETAMHGQQPEETSFNHFYYEKQIINQQTPMPQRYVREDDVVWETMIWRTVDFRTKFNQMFYYPLESEGIEGRKNLAFVLWDAICADEIKIYRDDECKIPIDNQFFVTQMTKGDTIQLEIIDDNENYQYKTIIVPRQFSTENILQFKLKEAWFVEKQSTQLSVRNLSLGLYMNKFRTIGDEQINIGMVNLFWIPLLSPSVQKLLNQHEAFDEYNYAHLPSWYQILHWRRFESFVTRESNRFNREIMAYALGEDALLESERIEEKILQISEDMWEY